MPVCNTSIVDIYVLRDRDTRNMSGDYVTFDEAIVEARKHNLINYEVHHITDVMVFETP